MNGDHCIYCGADEEEEHAGPCLEEQPFPASPCSRLFRSGVSGLWYRNPKAAGYIDCVEIDGNRLERSEGELSMDYIHRVGEWATEFFPANGKVNHE